MKLIKFAVSDGSVPVLSLSFTVRCCKFLLPGRQIVSVWPATQIHKWHVPHINSSKWTSRFALIQWTVIG